jgi:outer membrane receptor protein involved in Fe transport
MHRFLGNVEYSYKRWRIDATIHAYGRARLPHTEANPEAYRLADYSAPYSIVNGQLTYDLPRLALYIGVENVLNWMQPSPIVAVDQPYSSYFDASMIWGPVMGRVVYVGLRYKIPYPTTHTTPTTETPEEE